MAKSSTVFFLVLGETLYVSLHSIF